MPIVIPAGMIEDRVETDAVNRNPRIMGSNNFIADIFEPLRSAVIFGAGFREKNGPVITIPDFLHNLVERPVSCVASRKTGVGIVNPLVLCVKINANDIQVFRSSTELGSHSARQHVPSLELGEPVH